MSTSSDYLGLVPGYVLFWAVFVLALGLFAYRVRQLLQYMFLGQRAPGFGSWGRRLTGAAGYVFSQLCQLKNLRVKDRAPLGHAFVAWGFFVFVVFYFFFIILAEGLGLTSLERTSFFYYYAWCMDIMAVLIIVGAGWGLVRATSCGRPASGASRRSKRSSFS